MVTPPKKNFTKCHRSRCSSTHVSVVRVHILQLEHAPLSVSLFLSILVSVCQPFRPEQSHSRVFFFPNRFFQVSMWVPYFKRKNAEEFSFQYPHHRSSSFSEWSSRFRLTPPHQHFTNVSSVTTHHLFRQIQPSLLLQCRS